MMTVSPGTVKWSSISAVTLALIVVVTFGAKAVNGYAEFTGKQRDIIHDINDLRKGQEEIVRKLDALGYPAQERRSPTR